MKEINRNDPCPCGSGKKYKQCCLRHDEALATGNRSGAASIPKAFQSALEFHQAGRLPEAKTIYQQILQVAPNHPDALHFLGAIAYHQGKNERAAELISKAISVNPSRSMYYNLGNALKAQGKLDEAVESYRKALLLQPDYAEAHVNLGNVLQAQGKLDEAVEHYRKALALKPGLAETHYNLGSALQAQGKLDEAIASFLHALELKPNHAEAHYNLGNVLIDQGNLDASVVSYRKALALRPNYAEAHYNLGNTLKAQGKLDAAAEHYRQALILKPDFAEAHYNLGNALQVQGNLDAAAESYCKALALKPDYAEAHYNLGVALQAQDRLEAAVESYRRALALKPDYAEAYNNMGVALQAQDRLEAAEYYRKALALKPEYAEAHNNLGNVLREEGVPDEAVEHYRQALALKPDFAEAHVGLAYLNLDLGQFEATQAELSRALELKPEYPFAWAMLAWLRKMTPEDGEWLNTALRLVSQGNSTLSGKETYNLQFAIGKYYDDTQQYDLAFSAYSQANRLKRQIEGAFDRTGFSGLIDTLIATHTADFINRQREGASLSRRPVLIVGMPRSGTSLVEQIIASHPDAFGAGELTFWEQQVTANMAAVLSGNYGPALLAKMAAGYEHCLQRYSADATRIVDKLPHNFLRLGLIHTVFPRATIIHARRNPVDTCVSIHFANFRFSHSYATDLEDLAFYYREYARLMRHWRNVLPADRLLEVPYEALVDDQAGWSRRIIEFTGLDWDERCLDFHKTERRVGTASNWQVRQKIYRTSKARWRHYEKHLGPLLGLLDLDL